MLHLRVSTIERPQALMVELVKRIHMLDDANLALDLAKNFELYKTLTQLAYLSGELYYERIHAIVDSGAYKLEFAMRVVYDLDKDSVK